MRRSDFKRFGAESVGDPDSDQHLQQRWCERSSARSDRHTAKPRLGSPGAADQVPVQCALSCSAAPTGINAIIAIPIRPTAIRVNTFEHCFNSGIKRRPKNHKALYRWTDRYSRESVPSMFCICLSSCVNPFLRCSGMCARLFGAVGSMLLSSNEMYV